MKLRDLPLTMNAQEYDQFSFTIGLSLAISSSVFIGSSFVIKKVALKKISSAGNIRASAGGFGYLRQWMWWLGFLSMGVGEAANLLAYAFAPAALVTPLGALSVLVAAVLASRYLNEKLNFIGKIGCLLCIIGSVVFVLHSPKSEEISDFSELTTKLCDYMFLTYVATILCMTSMVKLLFVPKFGNSNIAVYLLICSAIGSLTVVFCKGVALGIKESLTEGVNNFSSIIFWVLLGMSVLCIMIQINYLNKSLDIFNTSIVTPVYYVMFTVLVITASGTLFKEWEHMSGYDISGCICGFLILMIAVFMINAFKDIQISFKDLNLNVRQRVYNDIEGRTELDNFNKLVTSKRQRQL
ncbi:magnesium transporter NIPA2 [Epargyreus clarus]|uniref:magnesium transporter NIPA2 n=1 Tax=Epargyreus clarus TaxID=520877 RepID=UPI003C2CE7CB